MADSFLRTRCHYCSRCRSPHEIVRLGGGATMCWHCWEWHGHALRLLAGEPPPGCQECGVSFAELQARTASGDCQMWLVPKDGIYQVICDACNARYVPKRVDLFRPTQFGHNQKL